MKILMVCLGNICRSPMAEGILQAKCREHNLNWAIDSAGTESYHVGECPDSRAIRTAKRNGVDIAKQVARQFTYSDFKKYDVIYALADNVYNEIKRVAKSADDMKKVRHFMDELYPGKNRSVPDPWYGDEAGFQPVYELIDEVCDAIIIKAKTGDY